MKMVGERQFGYVQAKKHHGDADAECKWVLRKVGSPVVECPTPFSNASNAYKTIILFLRF